jgi:uncharacterized lipoprotein YbaY
MKHQRIVLYIFITLLFHVIVSKQQEDKRLTHAVINGEVRGNGTLPIADKNSYLLIELRLTRDDRPRAIARTKIKLYNNTTTHSFNLQFKIKYPLAQISPHNAYILSAKIRNGQEKLLYIGNLPVPVTERKEKQAKYLVLNVIQTRKFLYLYLE